MAVKLQFQIDTRIYVRARARMFYERARWLGGLSAGLPGRSGGGGEGRGGQEAVVAAAAAAAAAVAAVVYIRGEGK